MVGSTAGSSSAPVIRRDGFPPLSTDTMLTQHEPLHPVSVGDTHDVVTATTQHARGILTKRPLGEKMSMALSDDSKTSEEAEKGGKIDGEATAPMGSIGGGACCNGSVCDQGGFCDEKPTCSIALYSVLMKTYACAGEYEKACDVYEAGMSQDGIGKPDALMRGCLMKFAAECGRTALLSRLNDESETHEIKNYMSLIRSAARTRDVQKAVSVLKEMEALAHVEVDIAAVNSVLDVCVSCGDMQQAREILRHYFTHTPSTISCSDAASDTKDQVAPAATTRKTPGPKIDIITYNTLLKGFSMTSQFRTSLSCFFLYFDHTNNCVRLSHRDLYQIHR